MNSKGNVDDGEVLQAENMETKPLFVNEQDQITANSSNGLEVINQPQEESKNIDNDSVKSRESMLKVFNFEPQKNQRDSQKCMEFWRYLMSRPDIQPVKCTLIESTSKTKQKQNLKQDSCPCEDPPQKSPPNDEFSWQAILQLLEKSNLDKVAKVTQPQECRFCKDHERRSYSDDESVDYNEDLIGLNNWTPCSIPRSAKATVTLQHEHAKIVEPGKAINQENENERFKNKNSVSKEEILASKASLNNEQETQHDNDLILQCPQICQSKDWDEKVLVTPQKSESKEIPCCGCGERNCSCYYSTSLTHQQSAIDIEKNKPSMTSILEEMLQNVDLASSYKQETFKAAACSKESKTQDNQEPSEQICKCEDVNHSEQNNIRCASQTNDELTYNKEQSSTQNVVIEQPTPNKDIEVLMKFNSPYDKTSKSSCECTQQINSLEEKICVCVTGKESKEKLLLNKNDSSRPKLVNSKVPMQFLIENLKTGRCSTSQQTSWNELSKPIAKYSQTEHELPLIDQQLRCSYCGLKNCKCDHANKTKNVPML